MKSATIDLSPQFSSLYSVTADGAVASYVFRFAETFQLLVLNFNAAELETMPAKRAKKSSRPVG